MAQVNWLNFEQLDSALQVYEKPVLIEFVTEWCTYCKKMDQEVFSNEEIFSVLNTSFYAVRFDAESVDSVFFDGQKYFNHPESSTHQLAEVLASRNGYFAPPVLIFLGEDFVMRERVFSYLSRKKMRDKLLLYRGY